MSIFQWPFVRKQYAGLGNPRFVGDIVAANQAVNDALAAIVGSTSIPAGGNLIIGQSYVVVGGSITYNGTVYSVGQAFTVVSGATTFTTTAAGYVVSNDFFIVAGLDYITGITNTFNPGIIYLQGQFYVVTTAFTEGLYLTPNPTDTESKSFQDGNSRNIYTLMQAITTSTASATNTPVFSGNMNEYRIGLKYTNQLMQAVLSTIASLGTAANLNASLTPVNGQVALWNNLLTAAQIAAGYLGLAGGTMTGPLVLAADPTASAQAATKNYVDNKYPVSIKKVGNYNIGTLTSGGAKYTVTIGIVMPDTNYKVFVIPLNGVDTDTTAGGIACTIMNKTTGTFDVWVYPITNVFNNISLDFMIIE